jgi:predicted ArsR family transcriptional regulator
MPIVFLVVARAQKGIRAHEVAKDTGLLLASACRQLSQLTEKKLVQCDRLPSSTGPASVYTLTASGRQCIEDIYNPKSSKCHLLESGYPLPKPF